MDSAPKRTQQLPIDALIVGYTMSRLDGDFLSAFGYGTWSEAFDKCGERLGVSPNSLKNLRDEFDPLHPNARAGWWRRGLREGRRKIYRQLAPLADIAVLSMVSTVLSVEVQTVPQADIAAVQTTASQVARRMRTGRAAEEYVINNCNNILGIGLSHLLDMRDEMGGFDFRVRRENPPWLIEVKGLASSKGNLRFTDLEWRTASRAAAGYGVVVVYGLETAPAHEVVVDPIQRFDFKSRVDMTETTSWDVAFSAS